MCAGVCGAAAVAMREQAFASRARAHRCSSRFEQRGCGSRRLRAGLQARGAATVSGNARDGGTEQAFARAAAVSVLASTGPYLPRKPRERAPLRQGRWYGSSSRSANGPQMVALGVEATPGESISHSAACGRPQCTALIISLSHLECAVGKAMRAPMPRCQDAFVQWASVVRGARVIDVRPVMQRCQDT